MYCQARLTEVRLLTPWLQGQVVAAEVYSSKGLSPLSICHWDLYISPASHSNMLSVDVELKGLSEASDSVEEEGEAFSPPSELCMRKVKVLSGLLWPRK